MRRPWKLLIALLALTLVAAACGDDDDDEPIQTGPTEVEETEADDTEVDETEADETTPDETDMDETTPDETDMDETDGMADGPGTIVDVAVGAGDFTTLVAAVQAAGLVDTLSGEGPFTVFAPTDEAFAAALEALGVTAEELLADENLAAILTYHVVAGEVLAADVVGLDGQEVETVNGATVTITVDGDTVQVNEANVVATDVMASNGVIHVIDAVLLPPS